MGGGKRGLTANSSAGEICADEMLSDVQTEQHNCMESLNCAERLFSYVKNLNALPDTTGGLTIRMRQFVVT